jgi:hypothetical protein
MSQEATRATLLRHAEANRFAECWLYDTDQPPTDRFWAPKGPQGEQ